MKFAIRGGFALIFVLRTLSAANADEGAVDPLAGLRAINAVRKTAAVYKLRQTRHMLLVSRIPEFRRDSAVRVLDRAVARQLKLIEAVRQDTTRSKELCREAEINISLTEFVLGTVIWDSDAPELAVAERLAKIEERIFANDFLAPDVPDRFIEVIAKANLSIEQKDAALKLRRECTHVCRQITEESWEGWPANMRGLYCGQRSMFWEFEKAGVAADVALKFRALLTPAQLRVWEDELTGAKPPKI
jgi:hypothetical protein